MSDTVIPNGVQYDPFLTGTSYTPDQSSVLPDGYQDILDSLLDEMSPISQKIIDKFDLPHLVFGTNMSFAISSSALYQSAYKILEKASDSTWLERLIAIPSSYKNPETFWGNFNGKNKTNDANLYNEAMKEIRQLLSDYQKTVYESPLNQVQQNQDAGINMAVTGQGVESALSASPASSPSASPIEGGNGVEVASNIVSTVGGFVGFCAQVFQTFQGAKLAKSALATQSMQRDVIENGIKQAKQNAWNDQQLQDYLFSSLGLVGDNPYSPEGYNPDNSSVHGRKRKIAETNLTIEENSNTINPLSTPSDSSVSSADGATVLAAQDVFQSMSRFSLLETYYKMVSDSLASQIAGEYMKMSYDMETEYFSNNREAIDEMNVFNRDFFKARSATTEGKATTSLLDTQASIAFYQNLLAKVEFGFQGLKASHFMNMMKKGIEDARYSPFIMKALYGVDIQDTMHHYPGYFGSSWLGKLNQSLTSGLFNAMDVFKGIF